MELVANLWPVADQQTRPVQRFFIRACAMECDDALIGLTLKSLAATDFRVARKGKFGRWLLEKVLATPRQMFATSCKQACKSRMVCDFNLNRPATPLVEAHQGGCFIFRGWGR